MYQTIDFELVGVIPVVRFRLDNWDYYGILDTGSELTFFDKKVFPFKKKNDVSLSTIGATESKISIANVNGELVFSGRDGKQISYPVSGFSTDLSGPTKHFQNQFDYKHNIDAVFGADFMKKYAAKIDIKNKTLKIKK